MTYYLKYRPQKLEDLDLEEVRESLKKIVKSGKIPHAYLFSGPKGSGKTSAARILAKIVNCERRRKNSVEPCNRCGQCNSITQGANIDVIELDAASHRGIDEARTLRDAVKLAPARANKKVYIIDEAHMLTKEASNALLKTLEEPPEHVMFILATTNPEKLIETIRSRATNVIFKKADIDELTRSLQRVVKGEKIKTDKKTLVLIAKSSDGSFRDASKVLEQLVTEKVSLKEGEVEEFLFQRKALNVDQFLSFLAEKDTKKALNAVERVATAGVSMKIFTEAVISKLRSALLAKVGLEGDDLEEFSKDDLVLLIKLISGAVSELRDAIIEQMPVELAIVEWCEGLGRSSTPKSPDSVGATGQASRAGSAGEDRETKRQSNKTTMDIKEEKVATDRETRSVKGTSKGFEKKAVNLEDIESGVTEEVWASILTQVKPKNTSTEALLRAARPLEYDGKTLTLGVFYSFHKEKLESGLHRRLLEEIVTDILGNPVKVVCRLTEPQRKSSKDEKTEGPLSDVPSARGKSDTVLTEPEDEDIIKVAKDIFGS